jgi:LuxR family maltose regulon positive regulatory protein
MARATPRVEGATLVARADDARAIPVGTPAWYAWLDQATTFAFVGPQGRFTAHKESRGPACGAWRACRKQAGRVQSTDLGRSADLTLERLQNVAASLAAPATPGGEPAVPLAEPTTPVAAAFPTGTVTFLFTDIEGSTMLWEQHPQAMSAALARHDVILRETIAAHGGVVFKTVGDAFHGVFATASAAVDAALALQRALHAEGSTSTCQLRVRVALHTGVAELRDGDYFGPPLNRVARLLAAAHGGQILLSLATEELVRDQLPPHVSVRDLGTHPLKDLRHPEQIFQLVTADLPADFPPLRIAPQLQPPAPDLALLTTKLTVPPPRPKLVPRPRLLARLQAGLRGPLTLIAAPAGFGKTTLLASWLASVERRTESAEQEALSRAEHGDNQSFYALRSNALRSKVAWVTLDAEDNDPQRFWRYVLTALEGAVPGIAATPLALLQSPQPAAIEAILTSLLNALNAAASDVALVLDDYHLITAAPIHQAVIFLLDHLPVRLHLVIASRIDPPLPLGRLRARGQLTEIRAADLRFSPEEAGAFFSEVMDLDLRPAEVAALEHRTEGWIAGLQLAALSLHGQGNRAAFIAAFTGSHRYVLDYLIDEVLARQSEEVQSFLLQTAVLDRLTGPLCAQLTGQRESAQLLMHLERSNLFIVPLDAERTWYRYHHLFGQLLRSRLQELWPERVPELHLQASAWYQANDFPADAIQHALAARAADRAATLIEQVAPAVYTRGESATLLGWCQALEETVLQARPGLCVLYAAALSQVGQLEAAEALLNQIAGRELSPQIHSSAASLRAGIACIRGDMERAVALAREALATAGADQGSASTRTTLYASGTLVEALTAQGKIEEAMATCRHTLELAHSLTLEPPWSVVVGLLHLQLSQLYYERDELEVAARHVAEALRILEQARHEGQMAYCHAVLARIHQAQGRPQAAVEHIQAAVLIAERWDASPALVHTMSHLVGVWLMRGDVDAVRQWAQAYQERGADEAGFRLLGIRRDVGDSALARALLATGQVMAASRLLDQLVAQAQAGGQSGNLIEIRALQALALQAQGQLTAALQTIEQALALGEGAGYFRLFVDAGAEMAALLTALLRARRLGHISAEEGASTAYVRQLLAAFPQAQNVERRAPNEAAPALRSTLERSTPLVEPLSERELEVLRLIVAGYSNPEIGQRLVIATGTVKRHINSIFSKLDVHSRAQAIARARELKVA